jgi:hypothetical protein
VGGPFQLRGTEGTASPTALTSAPTFPCPTGDQFALFESVVALSMLVRRFDFSMAAGAPPVGMTTGATIHTTNGLNMAVRRRGAAAGGTGSSGSAAAPPPQPAMALAFTDAAAGVQQTVSQQQQQQQQ